MALNPSNSSNLEQLALKGLRQPWTTLDIFRREVEFLAIGAVDTFPREYSLDKDLESNSLTYRTQLRLSVEPA